MSTLLKQFGRTALLTALAVGLAQSLALAKGGHGSGGLVGAKMSAIRGSVPRVSANPGNSPDLRQSGNQQSLAKLNNSKLTSTTTSQSSPLTTPSNRVPRNTTLTGPPTPPHPAPVVPVVPEVPEIPSEIPVRLPDLGNPNHSSPPRTNPPPDAPPSVNPPGNRVPRNPAPSDPPSNRVPRDPAPTDPAPTDPAPPSGWFPLPVGGGSVAVGEDIYIPPTTTVSETPTTETPATDPRVTEESDSVDLVLEDVRLSEPATLVAGPSYRLKFRNQGLQACRRFRVALVAALDGQLSDSQAVVDVPGLAAGEVREMTLRLPISSMKLVVGTSNSPRAFSHLVVAIDPDNAVIEADKTNNVAAVERTELEQ